MQIRSFCSMRWVRWQLTAFAMSVLSGTTASAEIFPAIVIGGFYQQTTTTISSLPPAESSCSNVTACFAVFGRVPNGNLSCSLSVSSGDVMFARLVPQLPNGSTVIRFQFVQATRAVDTVFTFNNTVLALFDSKQRPLLQVVPPMNATISSVACTIAGRIIDAPAT